MQISTSIFGKHLLNTCFKRDTDSRQQRGNVWFNRLDL